MRVVLLTILGGVIVAICGVVGFNMWLDANDRFESSYSSLADADKDKAIERGWIPAFLPQSSRAIHDVGELSPSTEWCGFEFVPTDSEVLRKELRNPATLSEIRGRVPNPHVSWWPRVLRGNLDAVEIHRAGFELYMLERPATVSTTETVLFVIDWKNGRGFFYSPYRR